MESTPCVVVCTCCIMTWNTSLPTVPFWATIVDGQCDWISTKGGGEEQ